VSFEALVSVIIPTYNRAKFLPTAINSVLDQTYKNVEIIVVDDGSTDSTIEVLRPFKNKIHYLTSDHKGTAHARNLGMKTAQGKYIAFLDSDDTYLPFKLELQISFIEEHPEVGMVCTEFSGKYENGRIDKNHMRNYHSIWDRKGWVLSDVFDKKGVFSVKVYNGQITYHTGNLFKYVLLDTLIPTNTILFPKTIIDKVGYQNEEYRYAQEYEFVVRICKHFTVAFLNVPTYVIFHHKNQSTKLSEKLSVFLKKKQNVVDFIEGNKAFLEVVMKLGYEDKDFYQSNRKNIDLRLGEIYCEHGVYWLEHGDMQKSREYLEKGILFAPKVIKYRIYLFLTNMPRFVRQCALLIIHKITKWHFLLKGKGLIGFIKNVTRFYK
jgi:glycosyltransferase involved in cell wall biosynthesis